MTLAIVLDSLKQMLSIYKYNREVAMLLLPFFGMQIEWPYKTNGGSPKCKPFALSSIVDKIRLVILLQLFSLVTSSLLELVRSLLVLDFGCCSVIAEPVKLARVHRLDASSR